MSAAYLNGKPLADQVVGPPDEAGNTAEQFSNNLESVLPGNTHYNQFRAQASSDLRRTMGINPGNALVPPKQEPTGSGSGTSVPGVDTSDLPQKPPPPPRRPQPSENNTEIQLRSRRPN